MLERQRKDDFLSMASHELKTPITTLKAFLQLIASNEGPEVVVSRVHLKKMGDQVDRLTRLVTDLLEVHKIQKGELEFDRDRIDMDPLVMEVVADARVKHQTHRFTLTGASGCVITGDRARISQALSELLTNAVKFSPDTDLIEVNIACAGEKVDLTVSDHGIGLHDQEQDRIFDRYYRVLTDPAKPFPGLGVGLFIVSEIVRHHGGSVAVSSIPGEGSAFTMSFPVERDGNAGQ
jgi:signal transduction histidine kinase